MSVLAGKNVLVVGDETLQIKDIEIALRKERMNIFVATCMNATVSDLLRNKIDIILINHLHEDSPCDSFFGTLRNTRFLREVPIFALVPDTERDIRDILMLGAADYVTTTEPVASVVKKMKVILGESDNLSSSSLLEVPVDIPTVIVTGRRVFVVEDDSLLRNLLTTKLELSSLTYAFAPTGEGVVEHIKSFKPNVIILDLMLPGRDGFAVLEDLKREEAVTHIPVIVFSNRDSEEDKKRAFSLGAERYYVKAMTDLSALITAIDELS